MAFTVDVHPEWKYQTMKGFGHSSCWWGPSWPSFYSEETLDRVLTYLHSPTEGIGLTHYRYNVGGGTDYPNMSAQRRTKCIEVAPGQYDMSVDATNIRTMEKALALGAKHVTLFMNSPPARMTVTGDTVGNPTGETNQREDTYEDYARYVADITKLFVDAGYPIVYVSPINEPQWDWSKSHQEGCHYTVDQVMTIDKLVIEELERKCPSVKISMPETAAWYHYEYTLEFIRRMAADPIIRNHVDHFCGHSYCSEPQHRQKVFDTMAESGLNVPLHQTEWAEMCAGDELGMDGALFLSDMVHQDLTIMSCPLWEFWVGSEVADTNWRGILVYVRKDGRVEASKKMWALGNYSRFLPGTTRVGLTISCAERAMLFGSAYTRPEGGQVVVLTNNSTLPQELTFTGTDTQQAQVFLTDADHDLTDMGLCDVTNGYVLPPRSIATLLFN